MSYSFKINDIFDGQGINKNIKATSNAEAINKLTDIQKRRVKKYYFHEMTQQEIADDEGVNIRAVQYTLNEALKKLKEILK